MEQQTPGVMLVVEDDMDILILVRRILLNLRPRIPVLLAADGLTALQIMQHYLVLLVILDYNLPGGISGMDLAQQFRASWPDLPLIMITAYATPELIQQAQAVKMIFIAKPFTVEQLEQYVSQFLPHH